MEPLYTAAGVKAAYQLRWSLAVFSKDPLPAVETWLPDLKQAVERDSVRILEVSPSPENVWHFYLTTQPEVPPPAIVKSVKGRLQHRLRPTNPDTLKRNFSLKAVGDARRDVVEDYVASQLGHHRMADARVQSFLQKYQVEFPDVDLTGHTLSSHGAYTYNLHLVLVHDGRWNEVRDEALEKTRDMVLRVARNRQHRLSRMSLLADHLHLVAGIPPKQSPQEVALGYMNNLAFAHGMRAIFCHSYYVGTVGNFDTGAILNSLAASRGPTDTGSAETRAGGK
jgi:REP element-mobilizing transposase RayT